ncbi:MAG: hypothetical protein AAGI23_00760 [Bacteroidota bacterium]
MANKQASDHFQRNYRRGTLRYHLSSFWLGYLYELKTQAEYAFSTKRQPEKKFVIFTSGRSGSTLLVDLLNSHPQLQCDDELLKRRVAFPKSLIRTFEQQSQQPIYGFKLLSYQLMNVQTGIHDKRAFLDHLTQQEQYQLIHLARQNKAKQALSIIYAFYRGQWHNQSGSRQKQTAKFELSPDIYLFFLEELVILEQFEQQMLQDRDYLSLTYETDLGRPEYYETTMQCVADFLNIDNFQVETSLRKVTPSKLSDMITNQEELVNVVRNSRFEQYAETLAQM